MRRLLIALLFLCCAPAWAVVAFDAFGSSTQGTGNLSWTHTPAGTPKGVIVFVVENDGVDGVTSATYGGTSMTECTGSPRQHNASEPGTIHCFTLLASVPAGAQTVSVTMSDTTTAKRGGSYTVTSSADTSILDVDATISSDSLANPSVTMQLTALNGFCSIGFHSGQNAPTGITPLSGWTGNLENDFGTQNAGWYKYDTVSTADVTAGWTQGADDAVMIAIVLKDSSETASSFFPASRGPGPIY